uniref:Uncharacterized protein n=1 Tax=Chromera velia CCMP2878 TaxID=1169474 RepID=A0A0G4GIQ6_9ALVE|eukprot:Cvel_22062.t1-p1 / transcript=Cvel_22062.t1 / gene=Cvel_22062 / organism=Chromera_velia_CCMP2878 / gene_product=hypothetical protein / transcript_product=hypothetical protein / location=Cvel_scaffold2131:3939-5722(+) / protein_length=125 / sequence_SO=supercontig / SO=protein_coding / is_pseudo=false
MHWMVAMMSVYSWTAFSAFVLSLAAYCEYLEPGASLSVLFQNGEQVATALHNGLIVMEMLTFAFLHRAAFSPEEFASCSQKKQEDFLAKSMTLGEREVGSAACETVKRVTPGGSETVLRQQSPSS